MIRKLSSYEKFFWIENQKYPYNCAVIIKYIGSIKIEKMKLALKILQKRHIHLDVVVNERYDEPYFEKTESEISFQVNDSIDVKKQLHNLLHTPFDYKKGPLMRVVLMPNCSHLLLSVDHLIIDGIAWAVLIKDLFEILASLHAGNEIKKNQNNFAFLPIDKLLVSNKIKCQNKHIFFSKNRKKREIKKHVGIIGKATSTGIVFRDFTKTETSNLINKCKDESTTVHGALLSAMILSLSDVIKKESICTLNPEITYASPVNLRPYLKNSATLNNQLGCYFSLLFFQKTINDDINFWDLARSAKEALYQELNENLVHKTISNMKNLMSNVIIYDDLINSIKRIEPFISVSNLGKIPLSNAFGGIKIEKIYYTSAMHGNVHNENNFFVIASSFLEKLSFSFMYPKPLMSNDKAAYLSNLVSDKLNNC